MKRYLLWTVAAVIALFAVVVATNMPRSPEEKLMAKDQAVIDECWEESRGTTITPAERQVVISACEVLEKVYRYNNGTDPAPTRKIASPT